MSDTGYTTRLRGSPIGLRAYACPEHGAFELTVSTAVPFPPPPMPCPTCGAMSERTLEQNVLTRMALSVESGTGRSEPPPSPLAFNTKKMHERGQTVREFRKERRALHRDRDRASARARGLIR